MTFLFVPRQLLSGYRPPVKAWPIQHLSRTLILWKNQPTGMPSLCNIMSLLSRGFCLYRMSPFGVCGDLLLHFSIHLPNSPLHILYYIGGEIHALPTCAAALPSQYGQLLCAARRYPGGYRPPLRQEGIHHRTVQPRTQYLYVKTWPGNLSSALSAHFAIGADQKRRSKRSAPLANFCLVFTVSSTCLSHTSLSASSVLPALRCRRL